MNFSQVERGAMFLLHSDNTDTLANTGSLELATSRNIDASVVQSEAFKKEYAWIVEAATHGRELIIDDQESASVTGSVSGGFILSTQHIFCPSPTTQRT